MTNFKITGSGEIEVGRSTVIGEGAQIVFNKPGKVTLGDYCSIGAGVKIICSGGDVSIGDWTTLHDNCLVLSGEYVRMGEHCWFGQNCIIDGTGGLAIGRGVRVGMYSQIWSHVAAGEQIEGCTLIGERPVNIEDDVWLVGSCIVASGVTLGRRSVALIGSNITKSFPENSVLAGTPATLKPTLSFYTDITLDERWELISRWVNEMTQAFGLSATSEKFGQIIITVPDSTERLSFVLHKGEAADLRRQHTGTTVCCIEDKSYNKSFTNLEKRVLKYLAGNKARFSSI